MHPFRTQRIDRHSGANGAINAARQPQQHARKAVLLNIIAQAQSGGGVNIAQIIALGLSHLGVNLPSLILRAEAHHMHLSLPSGTLCRQRAIAMHGKRRAVKYQFVLAAKLIDVNQGQAGFPRPRARVMQAVFMLAAFKRRAIWRNQDFRALRLKMRAHIIEPNILANRHTYPHTAQLDRFRHDASRE